MILDDTDLSTLCSLSTLLQYVCAAAPHYSESLKLAYTYSVPASALQDLSPLRPLWFLPHSLFLPRGRRNAFNPSKAHRMTFCTWHAPHRACPQFGHVGIAAGMVPFLQDDWKSSEVVNKQELIGPYAVPDEICRLPFCFGSTISSFMVTSNWQEMIPTEGMRCLTPSKLPESVISLQREHLACIAASRQ